MLVGSAQLAATGAVDGFAIFHQIPTSQEAIVPMETRNASSYLLAFDNTSNLVLGVAIENISAQAAVIPVIIRNDAGVVISSPGTTLSLGANGHTAFVWSDQTLGFPVTANLRGTIQFDTPAGGRISVLGLRFTPPNNALTTIPALANAALEAAASPTWLPAATAGKPPSSLESRNANKPASVQIGALRIRIPNVAAHTHTTLPH